MAALAMMLGLQAGQATAASVDSSLAASASGVPTSGNAPLNVSFTGSATGGTAPYTYSWNFGRGSGTSTTQDPSHTYTTPGTHTATLIVTDSSSPANTATSTLTITVNSVGGSLTATASGAPTSGSAPLAVSFTGSASGGTPPYTYSWNFGDGSPTSTTQDPSHTYTTPGAFTATLIVTDSASPANTATSAVSITVNPQAGNTVTITNPGNQTSTVGTAVSLHMQATDSQSGQTLTWSATGLPAGLSINSSSGLISGTPTTAGTSGVTVRATDTTGASGSASFSWTVNPISASSLCQLTLQDVQSSARYQRLPVSAQDFLDTLATAACEQLDNIVAGLSARQKAESLRAYDGTVELLADTGWLTDAQASSLQALAATL